MQSNYLVKYLVEVVVVTWNKNVLTMQVSNGTACNYSSLSVGHSRRHVGGPTNWDLA